jgi:ubiquitin carboxyl-terminal hydrolase 7
LLPKTSTFADVAEALAKLVTLDPNGSRKVRIFEIAPNGRQQKECTSSEMIANLREPAELYAEEIPLDETNVTDDSKVIDVFHYHRDPTRYFGVPFRFVLKNVSGDVRSWSLCQRR